MSFPVTENIAKSQRHISFYLACGMPESTPIIFLHGHTPPPVGAVGRFEERRQGRGRRGSGGGKIRLNSQGCEDARTLTERAVLMVVARLYALPERRPARFERIDHDGLHEAGYGPDDFE